MWKLGYIVIDEANLSTYNIANNASMARSSRETTNLEAYLYLIHTSLGIDETSNLNLGIR